MTDPSIEAPSVPRSLSPLQGFLVFLAGATVLFVEIAGSKVLAVIFGSSLYVWSALITVTLLSIALGAGLGGKVADRWPVPRTLAVLYLGAGIFLGAAVPLRRLAFPLAEGLDLRAGTFLSALMLYFLPLALLSAVPPVVVRLNAPSRDHLGRTVGWISALGTTGSFIGALATGFFLVPNFPLSHLFLLFAFLLALLGAVAWKGRSPLPAAAFLAVWAICLFLLSPVDRLTALGKGKDFVELETRQDLYGQTQVLQVRDMRMLFLDGIYQGGVTYATGVSLSEYTATMEVLGFAAVPRAKRALVVGLGAGVLPSDLYRRGLDVDAVDINPQVVDVYSTWFDPAFPRERLHVADGRRYVARADGPYDLVFVDVYAGEEIPSHMLTREAFAEARETLSEDGALVLNYLGFRDTEDSRVLATLLATLRTSFAAVQAFSTQETGDLVNVIVVARKTEGPWAPSREVVYGEGRSEALSDVLAREVRAAKPLERLFTDDWCPVDYLDRELRFAWRREKIEAMRASLE
jgi:spermidine synthase